MSHKLISKTAYIENLIDRLFFVQHSNKDILQITDWENPNFIAETFFIAFDLRYLALEIYLEYKIRVKNGLGSPS